MYDEGSRAGEERGKVEWSGMNYLRHDRSNVSIAWNRIWIVDYQS